MIVVVVVVLTRHAVEVFEQVAKVVFIERTDFEPTADLLVEKFCGLGVTFHFGVVHREEVTSKRCVELGEEVPNAQGHILEDRLGGNLCVVQ